MLSTLQGAYKIYLHFEIFAWINEGMNCILSILDAICRRAGRRADDRFLITMGIGNTGAMRVEARGCRRRCVAGGESRIVGETGRLDRSRRADAARRRRVAPATAMKKGTEDKDGGDYDATNGEVRFAELPRLREWAVQAAERRGDEGTTKTWRFGISLARVTTPKRRHGNTIIRKALVRSKLGSERSCTNEDIVKCFHSWAFLGLAMNSAMALTQLELVQSRRDDGNICLLDVSCGPGCSPRNSLGNSTFRTVVAVDYSRTMCEVNGDETRTAKGRIGCSSRRFRPSIRRFVVRHSAYGATLLAGRCA